MSIFSIGYLTFSFIYLFSVAGFDTTGQNLELNVFLALVDCICRFILILLTGVLFFLPKNSNKLDHDDLLTIDKRHVGYNSSQTFTYQNANQISVREHNHPNFLSNAPNYIIPPPPPALTPIMNTSNNLIGHSHQQQSQQVPHQIPQHHNQVGHQHHPHVQQIHPSVINQLNHPSINQHQPLIQAFSHHNPAQQQTLVNRLTHQNVGPTTHLLDQSGNNVGNYSQVGNFMGQNSKMNFGQGQGLSAEGYVLENCRQANNSDHTNSIKINNFLQNPNQQTHHHNPNQTMGSSSISTCAATSGRNAAEGEIIIRESNYLMGQNNMVTRDVL